MQGIAISRCNLPGGIQVGMDIGAAKTVNGLLWIANQKQRSSALGETGCKNCILGWIGILKFINQGDPETACQTICQGRAAQGVAQGKIQIGQQVIKTAFAFD